MFHVKNATTGYDWRKCETRDEAESYVAELAGRDHIKDCGLVIEEGDPFEAGYLFDRTYQIRQRLYELRNAQGEVIGIIGKPQGRGSDRPVPYQLRHGRLTSVHSGMSLYMALTNYGKGGRVDPGAASYIQGPDHRKLYGEIVESVKLSDDNLD